MWAFSFSLSERIYPMNVAIPVSLIGEDKMGQLMFTLFIQVSNGYLSKEQLNLAIQANKADLVARLELYIIIL